MAFEKQMFSEQPIVEFPSEETNRARSNSDLRPPTVVDHRRVTMLRAQGLGWRRIAAELKVGVGAAYRFAGEGSKIQERDFGIDPFVHG
jgi:hypothetical protein